MTSYIDFQLATLTGSELLSLMWSIRRHKKNSLAIALIHGNVY
jgi:hypothetical protein